MTKLSEIPLNTERNIKVFHIVVVCLSLMVTLFAWQFSKYQTREQISLRFEASRDTALALIVDRMAKYEDALWAGVAAVESHAGDIAFEDWRIFAKTLRIDERYPGINGIGVIHFHTSQTLDAYLTRQQQIRPDFRVFPAHDEAVYMPITFIEPQDTNAAAVGLDVAHEQNRRLAALASRDLATAQITGPITLVQDADSTPGFLFYAPLYKGVAPTTLKARREQFLGAVYAPFVVHKLMEGLLAKDLRDVRFSIRDAETMIYDEHAEQDTLTDLDPMFSQQVSLDLYGREWVVDLRTNLAFRGANTYAQSTRLLIAGLVIEALIIYLLFMMAHANKHAIQYADRVTAALRQKKAGLDSANKELSIKNAELEQFAYVASHDLKTPIRGIGGLTEMIEEDLEDYLKSPDANPEVGQNLMLIRDRVDRMNQLTKGIIDFARIDDFTQGGDALDLDQLLADLTLDLGLEKGQLRLAGDIHSIKRDAVNLRRVLENLISNAVKHHDGSCPLRIDVSAWGA
ncbi:MAG: CHASE domain-containing protein, partial [Sulfitobacter sp.]